MSHSTYSLLLNEEWDLCLDRVGRIRTTEAEYATAQNVANECRCFTNDLIFNVEHGIPWFGIQLGRPLMEILVSDYLREASKQVENVAYIRNIDLMFNSTLRQLSGTIDFTTDNGQSIMLEI